MDLTGYEVPRILITCRSRQVEVEGDGDENVPLDLDLADYNDREIPIPFRRRVFPSCYDGEHITCSTILEIIDDDVFDRIHDKDAVSLCCIGILQLIFLGVEAKRRIPNWMLRLENDRVGVHRVVPLHSRRIQTAAPSSILVRQQIGKPQCSHNLVNQIGIARCRRSRPLLIGNPLSPRILNILNRGKREQRPSYYKQSPYMEQPPTTILPKQRGNKKKNNVTKANLSPLNLGNAFADENVGGDDVVFLGGRFTGNYLVYENVDPQKVRREHYITLQEFLNIPRSVYLDCYMKGYSVPVTFWQQLVPHLCPPDYDSGTPMGWLSGEHMNAWVELLIRCFCPYMLQEIIGLQA
ncbi:hypothetical protein Tco_0337564 [Tanacetum coccineum]